MSMNPGPLNPLDPGLPQGRVLGNFTSFDQAQQLVDRVVSGGVAVDKLSIVGRDVRLVTQLRTQAGYPAVVGRSALQGAFFGLLMGMLISLLMPMEGAGLQVLSSVFIGVAVWVIFGVLGHAVRRRAGKYTYVPRFAAVSYDVVCDFSAAQAAQDILAGRGATQPLKPQATGPSSTGHDNTSNHAGPSNHDTASSATPGHTTQGPHVSGSHDATQPTGSTGASAQATESPGTDSAHAPGVDEQPETRGGFADLPDGRPQYGVRVDEQPQDPSPRESGHEEK